jgi:hypothetical protein
MALLSLPQWACSQKGSVPMNPSITQSSEDRALKHKFRGVYGGELRVDSTFETDSVIIINVDTGYLFNIGMGSFRPGADKVSGYGGNLAGDRLAMPRHLRMMRYPADAKFLSPHRPPYYEGPPLVDVTVPVAERIPEETLEDLRKNGGSLRLKLRIHPDTLLVGWDIARSRSHSPNTTDASGLHIYVPSEYSSIGGDFCEATIFNGRVIKKGWYIDPNTKQRIETDY